MATNQKAMSSNLFGRAIISQPQNARRLSFYDGLPGFHRRERNRGIVSRRSLTSPNVRLGVSEPQQIARLSLVESCRKRPLSVTSHDGLPPKLLSGRLDSSDRGPLPERKICILTATNSRAAVLTKWKSVVVHSSSDGPQEGTQRRQSNETCISLPVRHFVHRGLCLDSFCTARN